VCVLNQFWFGGMRCPPPAICTILTESKKLFGPRLHIYHEVYLVSQAGLLGREAPGYVKGAADPRPSRQPVSRRKGRIRPWVYIIILVGLRDRPECSPVSGAAWGRMWLALHMFA